MEVILFVLIFVVTKLFFNQTILEGKFDRVDYFCRSFIVRSTLTLYISFVTFVWLHLLCRTRDLFSPACAAHFMSPHFRIAPTTRHILPWFLIACIVVSVLYQHQDIHNTLQASGCCLESYLFHRLRRICQPQLQNPREDTFGIAIRTFKQLAFICPKLNSSHNEN